MFALVAVSFGIMAVGTLACYVSVGKKGFCFLVIILFTLLFDERTFVIESAEKVGSYLDGSVSQCI